ncbi:hypothetical protein FM036_30280 [Nostoc sp. HG1]|nr:hypothetical protein [Nostoc sp. HG1]
METFELGVVCCWSSHKFVVDEEGMKCLTCGRVMTEGDWEEKRKCFLGHTNVVPARASNPVSSRRSLNNTRLSSQQPRRHGQSLRWRDENPPVTRSRPRPELRWREENPPVNRPRPRTQLRWRDVPTNNTPKWQIIVALGICLVLLLVIIMLFVK